MFVSPCSHNRLVQVCLISFAILKLTISEKKKNNKVRGLNKLVLKILLSSFLQYLICHLFMLQEFSFIDNIIYLAHLCCSSSYLTSFNSLLSSLNPCIKSQFYISINCIFHSISNHLYIFLHILNDMYPLTRLKFTNQTVVF